MLAYLGCYCINASLFLGVTAVVSSIIGVRGKRKTGMAVARGALFGTFFLITVASLCLVYGFLACDYTLEYVYGYSSRALPLIYKVTAFWAGQAGSLLLWEWLLACFTLIVCLRYGATAWAVPPCANLILAAIQVFFLLLLTFVTPPFRLINGPLPADGRGLNPLLQNPGMIWHPPSLYIGYVGYSVPMAFALAALMTGELGSEWIRAARGWSLFAWFFLGVGILLGAQWAYVELGWGGYWAWDPVENASLIPWLTGTALLHSMMLQEKRGLLKSWNLVLVILTFTLCIFGTYLNRSGVVSSVHAFGQSNLGPIFLGFMLVVLGVSFWLLWLRRPVLQDDREFDSLISRETAFVVNNALLIGGAFAVLWGTIYPIVSKVFMGTKSIVTPTFFNQLMTPIGLLLLALTGICPLMVWGRDSIRNLGRNLLMPAIVTVSSCVILLFTGIRQAGALMVFSLCVFVSVVILREYGRGVRARGKMARRSVLAGLTSLIPPNRRRYGGHMVHLGIVLVFVGITGSSVFKQEMSVKLESGSSASIGEYRLEHAGVFMKEFPDHIEAGVNLVIYRKGQPFTILHPRQNVYHREMPEEQFTSEVALKSTLKEDIYVILGEWKGNGSVIIKVTINPLVAWMWLGGVLIAIGTHVAVFPERSRRGVVSRDACGRTSQGNYHPDQQGQNVEESSATERDVLDADALEEEIAAYRKRRRESRCSGESAGTGEGEIK